MIRIRSVCARLTIAAIALGSHLHPEMRALLSSPSPADAMHAPIEGFGASTVGGTGQPEYRVTSLADSGPGTLRDALSRGNRYIRFAVAGEILLQSQLSVQGPFVAIDGFSAPSPGITLRGWGINIWHSQGTGEAHDVIVRGIRIRDAGPISPGSKGSIDCISIYGPTFNIVIDHVSIFNCADGGIDISSGPKDITIQWSLVSAGKPMLWGSTSSSPRNDTDRISMHHTALICGPDTISWGIGCDRFPLIRASDYVVTADLRSNIFEGWIRANGTKIEPAAWVNVVGNAYIPRPDSTFSERAGSIAVKPGTRVFTAGNLELGALPSPNLNDNGNEASPLPAPPITARELGCVVRDAGMHPRDAADQKLLTFVTQMPIACADGAAPPPPPPTASASLSATPTSVIPGDQ